MSNEEIENICNSVRSLLQSGDCEVDMQHNRPLSQIYCNGRVIGYNIESESLVLKVSKTKSKIIWVEENR